MHRIKAAQVELAGNKVRRRIGAQAEGGQGFAALLVEGQQFGALIAFNVADAEAVACVQGDHGQAAGGNAMALQARFAGKQRRLERPGNHGQVHGHTPIPLWR